MNEGDAPSGLPKGWTQATIGDLIGSSGVFTDGDWVESKDQDPAGEVRLIQLADVGDGRFRDRSNRSLTLQKSRDLQCTLLAPGDVLIARMPDPLGRACLYPGSSRPAVTVVDVCIVRPSKDIDSRWLMHFVNSPQFRDRMRPYESGSTRKRISRKNLAKVKLPVPPIAEQRRIVAALDEQLSRLDAAEVTAAQVREKLLAYQASRESNIVPFPKAGTAEDALPDGWRMVRLSDISHSSGYGTSTKCGYGGAGGAVLRIPNVQSGAIDTTDLKYALDADIDLSPYKVGSGDLLVVRTNGSRDLIGRVAVSREDTEYAFASYLIRFKIKADEASPDWVAKVLSTRPWRRLIETAAASTAGQYNLNLKKLGTLPIPLPPLEQQRSLAAALDDIAESVRRLTSAIDNTSLKGRALRRALLKEAFAGRLVPQDLADEPAEVLLERVRVEREAAGVKKARRQSPRRAHAQPMRTPDTAPDGPPPPWTDAPALAATQPTPDLEMPS